MTSEKNFKIILDGDDIIKIRSFILENKRPKLSCDFADFISPKIQLKSVKCWLKTSTIILLSKKVIFYC